MHSHTKKKATNNCLIANEYNLQLNCNSDIAYKVKDKEIEHTMVENVNYFNS